MAGLDTSHAPAFATLLHDSSQEFHVPGARIVAAFSGGSPDFPQSINRVAGFTDELRDKHGVEIVDSLAGLRGKCDAVMLETIDGRAHLEQFREVSTWGVPVFIDKPLTVSSSEARELAEIARMNNVLVMSASALRFAEAFQQALGQFAGEPILGADFYGPMFHVEKCPGYFWYGIHTAEMLFAAMGAGCREVRATRQEAHDIIVGQWADGRLGVLRGARSGNHGFGGVLHGASKSVTFDVSTISKPYYASLLERVIPFFREGTESVSANEMVEVITFLEAANLSAESQNSISLLTHV